MPAALTREETPIEIESDGIEFRMQEIGSAMTAAFVRLPAGADLGSALVGQPGDLCQCPHQGYIQKGRVASSTRAVDEAYEAGPAFYWAAGHTPHALEDAEYVEFSPTGEFNELIDHFKAQAG
ncbi:MULTISPECIES: hypothetical protein [unclassified Streptomyces]|uniref:hypothetical protein n=1 Tax=unclassified Streptomyces TaxID=2593676 RepID=UPI002DDAC053|nr:hypothetical protein [Streptomyces sp. NBC_01800]WSA72562.1 hypothetical protein OIE65_39795 [Streptomyces sp. NBC_01800]WSA81087.1 hypothetical protein OG930_39185 [Streptomyces sp. NBC_01799]